MTEVKLPKGSMVVDDTMEIEDLGSSTDNGCIHNLVLSPTQVDAMEWLNRVLRAMVEKGGANATRALVVQQTIPFIVQHDLTLHMRLHQIEAALATYQVNEAVAVGRNQN